MDAQDQPAMDPDVAQMLLGMLGQASLKLTDPDLLANAEVASRAMRQLTALAKRAPTTGGTS